MIDTMFDNTCCFSATVQPINPSTRPCPHRRGGPCEVKHVQWKPVDLPTHQLAPHISTSAIWPGGW